MKRVQILLRNKLVERILVCRVRGLHSRLDVEFTEEATQNEFVSRELGVLGDLLGEQLGHRNHVFALAGDGGSPRVLIRVRITVDLLARQLLLGGGPPI